MATLRIEGLDELQKGLMDRAKMDTVKKIVAADGAQMQREMMQNAVFTKEYSQGTTQASISLKIKDGGMTAEVGPGTDYSPYLEYGTRYMEAQPFVSPTFAHMRAVFLGHLKRLFK